MFNCSLRNSWFQFKSKIKHANNLKVKRTTNNETKAYRTSIKKKKLFLGCWFVLASHATYWQLKTCWSMKHHNHVNVNNYRLATISPFLTYVYLVGTPLISSLLKAMYLYHRYVWTGPYDAPPFFSFFFLTSIFFHINNIWNFLCIIVWHIYNKYNQTVVSIHAGFLT